MAGAMAGRGMETQAIPILAAIAADGSAWPAAITGATLSSNTMRRLSAAGVAKKSSSPCGSA